MKQTKTPSRHSFPKPVRPEDHPGRSKIAALLLLAFLLQAIPAHALAASSWNPGLLVNTESFQTVDDGDSTTDIELRFGGAANEILEWEKTHGRFHFTDDLLIDGTLSASGAVAFDGATTINANTTVRGALSGANLTFMGATASYILGSLGIGTTDASAAKLVVDAGSNTTGIRLLGTAETAEIGDIYMGSTGQMVITTANTTDIGSHIDIDPEDDLYGLLVYDGNIGSSVFTNFFMNDAATDYMNMVVGNSNATAGLVLQSGGNVGIGTTSPAARLSVSGSLIVNDAGYDYNDVRMEGDTDANLFFMDASTDRIGLGTATPETKLDVVGTISGANLTFMGATASYILGSLGIGKSGTPNTKLEVVGTISGSSIHAEGSLTASGALMTETGANLDAGTLVVDAGNNRVGIGTTTPNAALDIRGDTYVLNAQKVVWANSAATTRTAIEGNTSSELIFYTGSPLTQRWKFDSSGNIILGLNTASAGTSAVRAFGIQNGTAPTTSPADLIQWYANDWNGAGTAAAFLRTEEGTTHVFGSRVGIGTITPKAQLDVVGTVSGSRLSVSGNANITGSLLSVGGITSRSTVSGSNLTFMGATASYILGSLGIGKTAPATQLEVAGTISGRLVTQNGAGDNYFMGEVGIGTTSPGVTLDVTNAGAGAVAIRAGSLSTGSARMQIKRGTDSNGAQLISGSTSTNDLQFLVNGIATALYLSNAGNVGIGTTSPAARLSVSGSVIVNDAGLDNDVRMEGDTDANLFFLDASTDRIGIGTTAPETKLDVVGTISGANLTFMGSTASYILGSLGIGKTAPTTQLEVAGTISGRLVTQNGEGNNYFMGNVGIGTTSPATLLAISHPAGTASSTDITTASLYLSRPSGYMTGFKNTSAPGTNEYGTYVDTGTVYHIQRGLAGAQQWWTNGASRMSLNVTGLGIGETSPGSRLAVSGGATIGASYDTTAAPTNGLLVEDNVGIGTTTPSTKLDVRGTISGSLLSIKGNANITGSLLSVGSITSRSTISGANLTFMGSTASYILGSLGIGTSSPSDNLHISESAASTTTVLTGLRMERLTTGTAAAGLGTGMDYYLEDAAGNSNQAGKMSFLWSDATDASEDSVFRLDVMDAGILTRFLHNTGTHNVFMGAYAGSTTITGIYNVGLGRNSLAYMQSGQHNVGIGYFTLSSASNTTASHNTAVGGSALQITTGAGNTALGRLAGGTNTTGTYNTLLGYLSDVTGPGLTNATAIGANAWVGASNSLVLGGTGANAVNVGIGTSVPGSRLSVSGSVLIGNNIGSNAAKAQLDVVGTISGSNLTFMGATASYILGSLGIGKSGTPNTKLEVVGTMSGRNLYISGTGASPLLFTDSTTGRVGIGTATPSAPVHLSDGNAVNSALITTDKFIMTYYDTAPGFTFVVADNDSSGSRGVFKGTRSRGTLDTPLVPSNSDDVVTLLGAIYDGVDNEATAGVFFKVDGTVSSNVAPQRIGFFTSETTGAARTEKLTIKSAGNVGIDTTAPAAKLSVSGSLIVNDEGYDNDVRMEGDTDANLFFMDASTDRVGIGTATPETKLEVAGTISGASLRIGGSGNLLTSMITKSATLDFANIGTANTCAANLTVTIPGAADGDSVILGVPAASVNATGKVFGWVSSANTVSLRYCVDGTTGDPASGTYRVTVMKF